jgi:DNA mismatch endonuclease (patch repair protein)
MTDVVSPETRSRMMSGIRGTNTRPEIIIRKKLHALGFRFRLHSKKLPGKPDIVLPRYRAVIFINGCFWHLHDCHLFKWPATRTDFWQSKLTGNRKNDQLHFEELEKSGWRVLVIWECALKGKTRLPIEDVIAATAEWLRSDQKTGTLEGNRSG